MLCKFLQLLLLVVLLSVYSLVGHPMRIEAGCGCDKPPPPLATVRPHVTYTGAEVALFHPSLHSGRAYTVVFTSGITGESVSVAVTAVWRRDLTDGQYKPQISVPLPDLPLGPTSISVSEAEQPGALLFIPDNDFTVAPLPLQIPAKPGRYQADHFEAAVSRSGVVYFSLDMTDVSAPMVFRVRANGYPLRFNSQDVMLYNSQGYLMQLLDGNIPGLSSLEPADKDDESNILQYSRHEFKSFYLQHQERQLHTLDPTDPNWHGDGSPHIDHDHLLVAITGYLPGNGNGKKKETTNAEFPRAPSPGVTPEFKIKFETSALFRYALLSDALLEIEDRAEVASDVVSNGLLSLRGRAKVKGDATAFVFDVMEKAKIEKKEILATGLTEILPLSMPNSLFDLKRIALGPGQSEVLKGPGSYQVSDLSIDGGQLIIDDSTGPIALYVTGRVDVSGTEAVTVTGKSAEGFALYVVGEGPVHIAEQKEFRGVVYAPQGAVTLVGRGKFYGSFVAKRVKIGEEAIVYYDKSLEKAQ